MRRLGTIALAAGLSLAMPGLAQAWTGVTTTALNLRASANGPVLTSMPPGAPLEVIGSCGGSWYHVLYAGYQGCAHSAYITTQVAYPGYRYPPAYPAPVYPAPVYPYGWNAPRLGLGLVILGLAAHAAHHNHWHWD